MKKKNYHISCVVYKSDVILRVKNNGYRVCDVIFRRKEMMIRRFRKYYLFLLTSNLFQEEKISFEFEEMAEVDRERIGKIFPYMKDQQLDIKKFVSLYQSENDKFPYDLYIAFLKAGLGKLAANLLEDPFYYEGIRSMEGKTLMEVFQLSDDVLQAAETGEDSMLRTEEERKILKKAYLVHPEIFRRKPITKITEIYLSYYFTGKDSLYALSLNFLGTTAELAKTIEYLNQIEDGNAYSIFQQYQNYLIYSEIIGRFLYGRYPEHLRYALMITFRYLKNIPMEEMDVWQEETDQT